MIGLLARGARLYAGIVELFEDRGVPLSRVEISRATGFTSNQLGRALEPLIRRKFISVDDARRIAPLTPPHEIVCADVCAELMLSMDEIRGPSKGLKPLRGRHLIALRLRREFKYPVSAICKVINRHPNPVDEYFHQDRASRRSKQRSMRQREERVAA